MTITTCQNMLDKLKNCFTGQYINQGSQQLLRPFYFCKKIVYFVDFGCCCKGNIYRIRDM